MDGLCSDLLIMVNQTVHPSGVGKLVAIIIQWVTAVEVRKGKRATVRWLAAYAAGDAITAARWFPAVRTGVL
jgi:hypothetical protein